MVKVKLPGDVGVPDNTPPAVRVIPGGRLPPVCDHIIGAVPVAAKVKLYAVLTVPCGGAPVVIVGATGAGPVAENSHVSVTELAAVPGNVFVIVALLVSIVPVKPAGNVCPACAVSVTLAVYCWLPVNIVPTDGVHVTALILKLPVPVAVLLRVAPITGAVTPIAALFIGAGAVAGNRKDTVTTLPAVPADVTLAVAVCPFIVAAKVEGKVCPVFAVRVTNAWYCVPPVNGLLFGVHVTALAVNVVAPPMPVTVVLGAWPVVGGDTVIVAVGMLVIAAVVAGTVMATKFHVSPGIGIGAAAAPVRANVTVSGVALVPGTVTGTVTVLPPTLAAKVALPDTSVPPAVTVAAVPMRPGRVTTTFSVTLPP